MTSTSLIALPADTLRALAAASTPQVGGGRGVERDLAVAVALVAMAAALVLAFVGG